MIKEKFGIIGEVYEYVDGVLINHRKNTIQGSLKSQFINLLRENPINGMKDLFDDDNVRNINGNSQASKDGMYVKDGNYTGDPFFSMITTVNDSTYNTYGVQWKGVMVASEARSVIELQIGSSASTGGETNCFQYPFAFIDKSGSPLALGQDQTYEVLWGIYTT